MTRLRGAACLALGLAFFASRPTAAQSDSSSAPDQMHPLAPNLFLEKAYFSALTPSGKNLLFEGQPSVHYYFVNHFGDLVWQKEGGWRVAASVSGLLQVRMSQVYSNPVLTPSYRIRFPYLQFVYLERPKEERREFRFTEIGAAFAHYSNGQRQCTYQGFTLEDSVCVVTKGSEALAAQRVTNTEDGDFSTSYFAFVLRHRRGRLPTVTVNGRTIPGVDEPISWNWTAGLEAQIHPLEIQPGGMNGDQARDWGQHQVTGSFEIESRGKLLGLDRFGTGVRRIATEYTYRKPTTPGRRTDGGQIELSWMPDAWRFQLGFFGRVHFGSDYYNINYQDRQRFFSLGLMWDQHRLDKINTR